MTFNHAFTYPQFHFKLGAGIEMGAGLDLYKDSHQGTYDYENVKKYKSHTIWAKFEHFSKIYPKRNLHLPWPEKSQFMVNNLSEVREAAIPVCTYLSLVAIPVLNECTSIQAINSFMNTLPITEAALCGSNDNEKYVQHLIIAHMTDDKNFDALVSHIRGSANQYQSIYVESTLRSLGYKPSV